MNTEMYQHCVNKPLSLWLAGARNRAHNAESFD